LNDFLDELKEMSPHSERHSLALVQVVFTQKQQFSLSVSTIFLLKKYEHFIKEALNKNLVD